MTITKRELKILKFVYAKKTVSYQKLSKKFHRYPDLHDIVESLVYHQYLIQIGGYRNNLGSPIPIVNDTLFSMAPLGSAETESKQWFNLQFVLLQIILPIVIAIITTLITIFLTALLSPSL